MITRVVTVSFPGDKDPDAPIKFYVAIDPDWKKGLSRDLHHRFDEEFINLAIAAAVEAAIQVSPSKEILSKATDKDVLYISRFGSQESGQLVLNSYLIKEDKDIDPIWVRALFHNVRGDLAEYKRARETTAGIQADRANEAAGKSLAWELAKELAGEFTVWLKTDNSKKIKVTVESTLLGRFSLPSNSSGRIESWSKDGEVKEHNLNIDIVARSERHKLNVKNEIAALEEAKRIEDAQAERDHARAAERESRRPASPQGATAGGAAAGVVTPPPDSHRKRASSVASPVSLLSPTSEARVRQLVASSAQCKMLYASVKDKIDSSYDERLKKLSKRLIDYQKGTTMEPPSFDIEFAKFAAELAELVTRHKTPPGTPTPVSSEPSSSVRRDSISSLLSNDPNEFDQRLQKCIDDLARLQQSEKSVKRSTLASDVFSDLATVGNAIEQYKMGKKDRGILEAQIAELERKISIMQAKKDADEARLLGGGGGGPRSPQVQQQVLGSLALAAKLVGDKYDLHRDIEKLLNPNVEFPRKKKRDLSQKDELQIHVEQLLAEATRLGDPLVQQVKIKETLAWLQGRRNALADQNRSAGKTESPYDSITTSHLSEISLGIKNLRQLITEAEQTVAQLKAKKEEQDAIAHCKKEIDRLKAIAAALNASTPEEIKKHNEEIEKFATALGRAESIFGFDAVILKEEKIETRERAETALQDLRAVVAGKNQEVREALRQAKEKIQELKVEFERVIQEDQSKVNKDKQAILAGLQGGHFETEIRKYVEAKINKIILSITAQSAKLERVDFKDVVEKIKRDVNALMQLKKDAYAIKKAADVKPYSDAAAIDRLGVRAGAAAAVATPKPATPPLAPTHGLKGGSGGGGSA